MPPTWLSLIFINRVRYWHRRQCLKQYSLGAYVVDLQNKCCLIIDLSCDNNIISQSNNKCEKRLEYEFIQYYQWLISRISHKLLTCYLFALLMEELKRQNEVKWCMLLDDVIASVHREKKAGSKLEI